MEHQKPCFCQYIIQKYLHCDTFMKNACCTPKAINFDFLEAPWPTKDLLWNVKEAYEALQEGFEALQSTSKHSQYVTPLRLGSVLFPNVSKIDF